MTLSPDSQDIIENKIITSERIYNAVMRAIGGLKFVPDGFLNNGREKFMLIGLLLNYTHGLNPPYLICHDLRRQVSILDLNKYMEFCKIKTNKTFMKYLMPLFDHGFIAHLEIGKKTITYGLDLVRITEAPRFEDSIPLFDN